MSKLLIANPNCLVMLTYNTGNGWDLPYLSHKNDFLPALLRPIWWVNDTEDDLCFGIVSRFELKGPFR